MCPVAVVQQHQLVDDVIVVFDVRRLSDVDASDGSPVRVPPLRHPEGSFGLEGRLEGILRFWPFVEFRPSRRKQIEVIS